MEVDGLLSAEELAKYHERHSLKEHCSDKCEVGKLLRHIAALEAKHASLESALEQFRLWLAADINFAVSDDPVTTCLTIARSRIETLEQKEAKHARELAQAKLHHMNAVETLNQMHGEEIEKPLTPEFINRLKDRICDIVQGEMCEWGTLKKLADISENSLRVMGNGWARDVLTRIDALLDSFAGKRAAVKDEFGRAVVWVAAEIITNEPEQFWEERERVLRKELSTLRAEAAKLGHEAGCAIYGRKKDEECPRHNTRSLIQWASECPACTMKPHGPCNCAQSRIQGAIT